jgi:integrase
MAHRAVLSDGTAHHLQIQRKGWAWPHRTNHSTPQFVGSDFRNRILAPFLNERDPNVYLFSPSEAVAELRLSLANERAMRQGGSGGNRKPKALKPKRAAGEGYDVDSYHRAIKRTCLKAAVEEWAPNQLRHTAATEIRRRFGVESARTILGHSDIATSEIYAKRDHEMASRIASEIG